MEAGAPPQTPLGELSALSQTPWLWWAGIEIWCTPTIQPHNGQKCWINARISGSPRPQFGQLIWFRPQCSGASCPRSLLRIYFFLWTAGFWLLQLVVREKKSVRSTELIHTTMIQRKRIATHPSTQPTNQRNTQPTTPHPGFPIPDFPGCFDFDCPDYECPAELSTGRMDPRVGSGRVGSGRVGSRICRFLAGRVGSGQNFRFLYFVTDNWPDYYLFPK